MKFNASILFPVLSLLSTPTSAQSDGQLELVFTQPAGGVYTQGWYAQSLESRRDRNDMYVVGDGKLGDFFGVISVDCREPSNSTWIATGGYLSSERVPIEAIRGVRETACGS